MNGMPVSLGTFSKIVTGRKTATTTPTELFALASRLPGRQKVAVKNTGTDNIGIGDSTLAVGTGWLLEPGDAIEFNCGETPIFICSSSTADYAVVEVG